MSLDVCELDPDLVNVAEKWFKFEKSNTRGGGGVNLYIEDGVSFVTNSAANLKEKKKRCQFVYCYMEAYTHTLVSKGAWYFCDNLLANTSCIILILSSHNITHLECATTYQHCLLLNLH